MKKYAKAAAGAALAGLGAAYIAADDGAFSLQEWIGIAQAAIAAGAAVWGIPNRAATPGTHDGRR